MVALRRRREQSVRQPAYRKTSKVPISSGTKKAGQGVPDVSADADPNFGCSVIVAGRTQIIGFIDSVDIATDHIRIDSF